jgi:hypothetical protein
MSVQDLLFRIWDKLPSAFQKNALPLLIGGLTLALSFSAFIYFDLKKEELEKVFRQTKFQIIVLSVTACLTIIYLKKLAGYLKLNKIKTVVLCLLFVVLEISYFLILINKNERVISIHLYQLDVPNYNSDILKYLLQELNGKNLNFNFVVHNQREIPASIIDSEFVQTGDSITLNNQSVHYKQIIQLLQDLHPLNDADKKKETVTGLLPYALHTNTTDYLFSVGINSYSVISTVDWKYKEFASVSIYKYIIHQTLKSSLVVYFRNKGDKLHYHQTDLTTGCIFDYHEEKTGIINTIANPKICQQHKLEIKNNLNEKSLIDFEYLIGFTWLDDKNVRKHLSELYKYEM